jgi:hypothetical protein
MLKILPNNHIPFLILQIRESKICPALILANKRKDNVIGRTNKLTASTKLKKGTKYQGVLAGRTAAIVLGFKNNNNNLEIQNDIAKLKFKEKTVVIGYE